MSSYGPMNILTLSPLRVMMATMPALLALEGLLLARIPEETVEERNAYYRSRAKDQVEAADNDLLKTNAHDSMRIDRPVRQSKVQFGGPKAG
jgi:hypothetical protein